LVFGRKDSKPPPMIPGIVHSTFHAQRCEVRRIPNPTRRVKKILTMPPGVLRRAEIGPVKPNPAIKVDE
jgi:hypothetical protein